MSYRFPLISRTDVADGTMAFTLDTGDSGYSFKPGQNADFTLTDPPHTDAEGNTRTFSIVNSPLQAGRLTFATRMRGTAFKNSLKEVPLGTELTVTAAMGQFTLPRDAAKPVAFIAGGIGITPFMSMLHWADDTKLAQPITLLYSNRTVGSTAFHTELQALSLRLPHFTYVPTLTDEVPADWSSETGSIDKAMIQRRVPDLAGTVFYTAGPPAMVQAMLTLLEELDIPEEHVRAEDFAGY